MKPGASRRYHTFVEKQKALLFALAAVALLDLLVSALSIKEIGRETTGQMEQLAALHARQVYEECSRVSYDMRRLLMENQDMTGLAGRGTSQEQIYAKGRLVDKLNYSFGSREDYHLFFYFEEVQEALSSSWLDMLNAKESGILNAILKRMESDKGLTQNLERWNSFQYKDSSYMLCAYQYNGVWLICYVPARQLTASLKETMKGEDSEVILLSEDGEILSGQRKMKEWKVTDKMLQEEKAIYRFPMTRLQIVREDSNRLGFSIALVMNGYGGLSRIIWIQAAVLFMVLVTLSAFFMMSIYTKKRIIAPVQKFVKGLQDYQESGEGHEELSVSDIHELEQINEQFRNFVHQIGALKISIYEEKLERQRLEMDNLKLQLKPHFFLNILSIVHRLLETGQLPDAKKMCLSAIHYLRYLFSAGQDSVYVKEAVEHVNDYLEIMKLRYPGEVETDIYVEEKAGLCMVPPLFIQTLVENAFKYGKQAGCTLEISITVTVETRQEMPYLCINVSDNGKGFPEEYLSLWEQGGDLDQKNGNHIGIANIRARLAYEYKGRAAVRFYNSPLGGAAAEIHIPVEGEGGAGDEHSFSR